MLTRRAFALGLLAAPAVVRAGSLEYVPRGSGLYVGMPVGLLSDMDLFTKPANYYFIRLGFRGCWLEHTPGHHAG